MTNARGTNTQKSARRALILAVLCIVSLAPTLVMASPAGASSLSWSIPFVASPALSMATPPSFTWSGATALGAGASNWSTTTNWGGTAPSGTVGTLAFPQLTNTECTASTPTETCYASNNNVSGLNVNAITLAAGAPYNITGNAFTLGAGGIATTLLPSTTYYNQPTINTSIALGADQTWTLQSSAFSLKGSVTGTPTLGIDFTGAGSSFLQVGGDMEVGDVAATASGSNGAVVIEGPGFGGTGSLNGTNNNPVTFSNGAGLAVFGGGTIGPLTMNGGQLQVGEGVSSDGVLTVNGAATFNSGEFSAFINQAGTAPGIDYSQLSVSGPVSLTNSSLSLGGGQSGGQQACPTLTPGAVDTLITAASVTGTFTNAPDGTVMPLSFCTGTPTVRINYTATTVTATVPQPKLSLSVPSFVHLTVGKPYHGSPIVAGGTPPYTWTIPQGTLPTMADSSFDSTTGAISGTPEYAGTSSFTVTVTDSSTPQMSVSRRVTVDVQPSQPLQHWQLCSHDSSAWHCPPPQTSNTPVVTSPHVAFVLVGNWWCSLYGSNLPSQCKSWTPPTCPGYQSCAGEASDLLSALNSLLAKDYSEAGQGGYDWGLANFYGVSNCGFLSSCRTTYVGAGVTRRYYAPLGGLLYAGPIAPVWTATNKTWQVANTQGTLNSLTGGFGIHSQAEVNNTVFVLLYAPELLTCGNPSTNSETGGGRQGLYGNFVYASVYLEDRLHYCFGDGIVIKNPTGAITPSQFATYALSHELDEAITDPNSSISGWLVKPNMQIADVCHLRNADGETGYTNLPYWNFTRDSRGTVVSAYVNPITSQCWPTVDGGIPPE